MRETNRQNRRLILKGLLVAVALVIGGGAYEVLAPPDLFRLNLVQRHLVNRVVQNWETKVNSLPEGSRVLVGYGMLLDRLNVPERSLVTRIFAINPKDLGFNGPFHSTITPENLVRVEPVNYKAGKEIKSTGVQYCPRHVHEDYLKMMAAMKRDLGKVLLINSGYRSPGRQAHDFLFYLARNHAYSLWENARWSALPGYSEHNDPVNCALDFINEEGIDGDSEGQFAANFEALPEYQWLLAHAAEFNFHLSYPKNNRLGISFEPWHWHWEKPGS